MVLDPFRLKTNQEIIKQVDEWFSDLEYLVKIRILTKFFPGYSIGKLEERGISKMWKSLSLERKKDIYDSQYKYLFAH